MSKLRDLGGQTYRQTEHHPGGAIIRKNVSLTCMTIIDTATGWFENFEILTLHPNEVTAGNGYYID